jgi:hypothetical protein
MDTGLLGGIIGGLGGLAGGIIGAWHEARKEAKRPDRQHFTFWPSPVNAWDRRDWINMTTLWVGVISWAVLGWCMVLETDYSVQYLFWVLTFFGFSYGCYHQVQRLVDKVNAKLGQSGKGG